MGFLDSLGCCASRPVRPRKQANRARGSGGGGGGGGASTVVDAALPAFVWSTADVVGDEATRTPMAEIQVGTRYFSEDGRHFVKDSEGNLVVTRPSERGESVLAFDEWMEEQKRAGSRQLAAHLSFGESAELASRMKSKALRRYTIPELVDGEGTLLDRRTLHALWQTVPPMCRVQDWVLVYGVKQHGAALSTLLRRASGIDTTLLVVKTTDGRLFGGFATSIWAEKLEGGSGSPVFFGRGTSWLYRFPVEGSADIEQFSWSRADQQFRALYYPTRPCSKCPIWLSAMQQG